MVSSCPICEQPIPGTSEHCDVCGFPTALAIEGLRAARAAPADPGSGSARAPATATPARPRPAPAPEAELTATFGRGLRERTERLRPLGRDCPDVTSEMCEAALSEASGRVGEALEILRGAQSRLDRQSRDAIRRRWEAADDRRKALERTGVRLALDLPPADSVGTDGVEEAAESVRRLVEVEARLSKFEADWKGIQGLLAQVETLRAEAEDLGVPLGEIPAQIAELRQKLSAEPVREEQLDALSQDAARVLMLLHEAVPSALEEELGRHGLTLARIAADSDGAAPAQRLHDEATGHLAKGRLVEATQSLRDLRRAIEEVEHPAPAAAPPARAKPPTPVPSDDETLATLLKKARSLAGRVRTLPPESAIALEAAAQIREATDQLRAGRLSDADRTLTELMRALSREEARH